MSYALHPPGGAPDQVTASDLVRHFGIWQDRAARAPVYVLHRGRPRLMLVSLDIMDALCAPHARGADETGDQLTAVVDAIDDMLLLVGADGRIVTANRTARARLGSAAAPGAAVAAVSQASGGFLSDAVARVLAGAASEQVDVVPDRFPTRMLTCRVDPLPGGCLVHARDATAAEELHDALAAREALDRAVDAAGHAAVARIGPRGHVVAPDAALARLTGVAEQQLALARFVTLVAVADRPKVGEAIEAAMTGEQPESIDAALLVRGADVLRVRIALSPVRVRGRVEEVVAFVAAT